MDEFKVRGKALALDASAMDIEWPATRRTIQAKQGQLAVEVAVGAHFQQGLWLVVFRTGSLEWIGSSCWFPPFNVRAGAGIQLRCSSSGALYSSMLGNWRCTEPPMQIGWHNAVDGMTPGTNSLQPGLILLGVVCLGRRFGFS